MALHNATKIITTNKSN